MLDTAHPHPTPAGAGPPLPAPHKALAAAPSRPEPRLFALPEICALPCSSSSFVGPLPAPEMLGVLVQWAGLPSCCWDCPPPALPRYPQSRHGARVKGEDGTPPAWAGPSSPCS